MRTSTGFEVELSEDVKDDWELLEQFQEIDNGNPMAMIDVAKRLLGDDYLRLKEHLRSDTGRVSAQDMAAEILEILNGSAATKNV